jgi:hypothetical protein
MEDVAVDIVALWDLELVAEKGSTLSAESCRR